MRIIMAVLMLFPLLSVASLQSMIDALPPEGGEVKLGCGTYSGAIISIPSDVAIVGSGPCTVIPSVRGKDNSTVRRYSIRIENLVIDGSIDGNQYIGVDFRNVSTGRVDNVKILNVQVGVLLYLDSYYNVLQDLIIDASSECFEVIDSANENIIRGGRCQSSSVTRTGIGLWVRNVNNVKVFGTSFENLDIGIKVDNGSIGTSIYAPRFENMNCGIKLMNGSQDTGIFSSYKSNITSGFCIDSGVSASDYKNVGF